MVGVRRRARRLALQALYEIDSVGHSPETALQQLLAESPLPEKEAAFVRELVEGVLANLERLDSTIGTYAPSFPVAQLSLVDRNILRLAIFEILVNNKVPVKVAINEAVELAKIFGSLNSPRFINGVLASVSARTDVEGKEVR